jgi:methionine-R-sulfoxide reductase
MRKLSLATGFALLVLATACSRAKSKERPVASPKTGDAMTPKLSGSGYDITPLSRERVQELAAKLSPEEYRITQKAGTEAPFCGTLLDNHKDGIYVCVVCGLPLFSSEHKFSSGTGWPSFYREVDPRHVVRKPDDSLGIERTEIDCARCGAHLGHVFDDGPPPTHQRFCLNSASLRFHEKGEPLPAESQPAKR